MITNFMNKISPGSSLSLSVLGIAVRMNSCSEINTYSWRLRVCGLMISEIQAMLHERLDELRIQYGDSDELAHEFSEQYLKGRN